MNETSSQTSAATDQTTPQPLATEATPPASTTTSTPIEKPSSTEPKSLLNEGTPKEKEAPAGAPEKYEAFTVPNGFTLDEAVATEAGALFKESGLSQAQAQKLVDFYTAKTQEAFEQPVKVWKDQQEAWKAEIKADPEIGGKLDTIRTTVSKAIDSLGDPKLASAVRDAMDYTGAGNNPAIIKAWYKMAQLITEGTHVPGNKPSEHGQNPRGQSGRPSLAASIYGPDGPRSERVGSAT